jgi:GntR family transcriptional regulator
MQIDRSSPIPLYKQIENYIRELVDSGEYDGGKLLPKEEDLAKRFGVSRNTVRQGMYKLVIEGLLIRKKGVGTVVAPQTITTHLDEWYSFTQEMSKQGVSLKNYSIKAGRESTDKTLAEVFQSSGACNKVGNQTKSELQVLLISGF